MNTGIIYKWTNKITGEAYIGQTMYESERIIQHMKANKNTKFHNAIREYGIENFSYEVLERDIEESNLNNRERYWVKYYDTQKTGYNTTHGGDCGTRHRIITDETRKKLSDSRKALKGKIHHSEETKKKISESNKGKHKEGHVHSEEEKKKQSESLKKYRAEHPDSVRGENNPFYGKHHSEETRKKLKEAWARRKQNK